MAVTGCQALCAPMRSLRDGRDAAGTLRPLAFRLKESRTHFPHTVAGAMPPEAEKKFLDPLPQRANAYHWHAARGLELHEVGPGGPARSLVHHARSNSVPVDGPENDTSGPS